MPKEIMDRAPSSADDPLDDGGREKPGIAYASTSDLRGFPMSPNGTALGTGRSTLQRPLEQPPPGTRFSAEQYAEAEKMLKRLDEGRPLHREPSAWEPTPPPQAPLLARDHQGHVAPPPSDAGVSTSPPGRPSTPMPLPRHSLRWVFWVGGAGAVTLAAVAAVVGLVSARSSSGGETSIVAVEPVRADLVSSALAAPSVHPPSQVIASATASAPTTSPPAVAPAMPVPLAAPSRIAPRREAAVLASPVAASSAATVPAATVPTAPPRRPSSVEDVDITTQFTPTRSVPR
jgi:hypothetical protein